MLALGNFKVYICLLEVEYNLQLLYKKLYAKILGTNKLVRVKYGGKYKTYNSVSDINDNSIKLFATHILIRCSISKSCHNKPFNCGTFDDCRSTGRLSAKGMTKIRTERKH